MPDIVVRPYKCNAPRTLLTFDKGVLSGFLSSIFLFITVTINTSTNWNKVLSKIFLLQRVTRCLSWSHVMSLRRSRNFSLPGPELIRTDPGSVRSNEPCSIKWSNRSQKRIYFSYIKDEVFQWSFWRTGHRRVYQSGPGLFNPGPL